MFEKDLTSVMPAAYFVEFIDNTNEIVRCGKQKKQLMDFNDRTKCIHAQPIRSVRKFSNVFQSTIYFLGDNWVFLWFYEHMLTLYLS